MARPGDGEPAGDPADAQPVQVVFVGQIPPPVHGQAVWNQAVAQGRYSKIEMTVVPMRFSEGVVEVGRFRLAKLPRIPGLIWRVVRAAIDGRRDVLFYAVGAKGRVAVLRDIAVLPFIRPWFRHTVFYVHTSAIRSLYDKPLLRHMAQRAYGRADLVIHCDPRAAGVDDQLPTPQALAFLPHGVSDPRMRPVLAEATPRSGGSKRSVPVILFVGNLFAAKGTHHLVRACGLLAAKGVEVKVRFAGAAPSPTAIEELSTLVESCRVTELASILGPLDREGVWQALADCDIFCFPTRYEAETTPLVIIEAMAMGLPVVSTTWRGVPALVTDGETGFLVEPDDDEALAARLLQLLDDPALRQEMGCAGRARYETNHLPEYFEARVERMLLSVVGR